jgi:glycosyltransferase involved in cell wall biosynthesis
MPIKVAHLTSVHDAFDVRIFHKQCRALAAAGYDVVLIAPHDRDDVKEGVRVRAVPVPQTRRERMTHTVVNVYRAALRENADLYHFHDPELMPVGVLLKAHGKRVIYDVHENYAATLLGKVYIPSWLRRVASIAVRACERAAAIFFDHIVVTSPLFRRPFPAHKATLIASYPESEIGPASVSEGPQPEYSLVYVGAVTTERGARTMVEALALLPDECNARLTIAGVFPNALRQELRHLPCWDKVRVAGWQSREQVRELLAAANVGLCVLHPTPNHVEAYPIKLFEYMAAGLPVIASDFPLWREFVVPNECGLVADPSSPQAIANAITWLWRNPDAAAQMGRNGRQAVADKYNWTTESARLIALYEGLTVSDHHPIPATARSC